jgi:lipopolysaccharide transport system ATP-binding protein
MLFDNVIDEYLKVQTDRSSVYYPTDNIVKKIEASQNKNNISLTLYYRSKSPIKQPVFGFRVSDFYGNPLFGANPLQNFIFDFGSPKNEGKVDVIITSPLLVDGSYFVTVWFSDGVANGGHIFFKENCLKLQIASMGNDFIQKSPKQGYSIPVCEWEFQ